MQRKVNIFGYFVVPKILQSADYLYGLSHLNVAMERENQDIHSKEYMVTTFEIARLWNIHQCDDLVIRQVR